MRLLKIVLFFSSLMFFCLSWGERIKKDEAADKKPIPVLKPHTTILSGYDHDDFCIVGEGEAKEIKHHYQVQLALAQEEAAHLKAIEKAKTMATILKTEEALERARDVDVLNSAFLSQLKENPRALLALTKANMPLVYDKVQKNTAIKQVKAKSTQPINSMHTKSAAVSKSHKTQKVTQTKVAPKVNLASGAHVKQKAPVKATALKVAPKLKVDANKKAHAAPATQKVTQVKVLPKEKLASVANVKQTTSVKTTTDKLSAKLKVEANKKATVTPIKPKAMEAKVASKATGLASLKQKEPLKATAPTMPAKLKVEANKKSNAATLEKKTQTSQVQVKKPDVSMSKQMKPVGGIQTRVMSIIALKKSQHSNSYVS